MRHDLRQASRAELHLRALEGDMEAQAEADRVQAELKVRVLELELGDSEQRPAATVRDERRSGPVDRRSSFRAWRAGSPGRRRDDVLRQQLREARLELRDAEARLSGFDAQRDPTS